MLKLTCVILKCLHCQTAIECKLCIKKIGSESFKSLKKDSDIAECTSQQICDACILDSIQCQYISKNIMHNARSKKENVEIVKSYLLNILFMVIQYFLFFNIEF